MPTDLLEDLALTNTVVDLATEREQRRMLAERMAEGGDAFIAGLQSAGCTLADLGWLLAAPVRSRDRELANGIYELVLHRLGRIVDDAVAAGDWSTQALATAMKQGKEVAFAAFTARMLILVQAASSQDIPPTSHEAGGRPDVWGDPSAPSAS